MVKTGDQVRIWRQNGQDKSQDTKANQGKKQTQIKLMMRDEVKEEAKGMMEVKEEVRSVKKLKKSREVGEWQVSRWDGEGGKKAKELRGSWCLYIHRQS